MKILENREITTKDGEISSNVTLEDVQPEDRITGTAEDGMPVTYGPGRGWMDRTIADNSMFFGW